MLTSRQIFPRDGSVVAIGESSTRGKPFIELRGNLHPVVVFFNHSRHNLPAASDQFSRDHAIEPWFPSAFLKPFGERCRSLLAGDFSSAIASELAPTIARSRLKVVRLVGSTGLAGGLGWTAEKRLAGTMQLLATSLVPSRTGRCAGVGSLLLGSRTGDHRSQATFLLHGSGFGFLWAHQPSAKARRAEARVILTTAWPAMRDPGGGRES